MKVVSVSTLGELKALISLRTTYVGSSLQPEETAQQLVSERPEWENFTMTYESTQNMKTQEDKLFAKCQKMGVQIRNAQESSKQEDKAGYVYIIDRPGVELQEVGKPDELLAQFSAATKACFAMSVNPAHFADLVASTAHSQGQSFRLIFLRNPAAETEIAVNVKCSVSGKPFQNGGPNVEGAGLGDRLLLLMNTL